VHRMQIDVDCAPERESGRLRSRGEAPTRRRGTSIRFVVVVCFFCRASSIKSAPFLPCFFPLLRWTIYASF
jgi:hypothetical protein